MSLRVLCSRRRRRRRPPAARGGPELTAALLRVSSRMAADWPRADAHIHLFGRAEEAIPGVVQDDAVRYDIMKAGYSVDVALIVGPPPQSFPGNNDFVAEMATEFDWLRPVAGLRVYELTLERLEELALGPWVGISLYTAGEEWAGLAAVPAEVWSWLIQRRWLVSVNDMCLSRGPESGWAAWLRIVEAHPELRLLISHLGLPAAAPPSVPGVAHWTVEECRERIADVLALAACPGPRVKLSGFYALTTPGSDYPHEAAWGYVQALLEAFTSERLLWASDFPPAVTGGDLSFPQTINLFTKMSFLTEEDRVKIEGGNLIALLEEVVVTSRQSETMKTARM